jgi:hypothetical protein
MQWSHRGADLLPQVRCATASSVPASYSCLTPIPAPKWLLLLDSQSLDGFPVIAPQGHRLADDDLEVALFVVPVPDVAAINADDDRLLPNLPLPTIGGVSSMPPGCPSPRSASWRAATRCKWRRMVQTLAVLLPARHLSAAGRLGQRKPMTPIWSPDRASPRWCSR